MATNKSWRPSPEQVRLLADRMCYLERGTSGLRWRHGMWNSDKSYRDNYDVRAEELAPQVCRQPVEPILPVEKSTGWRQMTL